MSETLVGPLLAATREALHAAAIGNLAALETALATRRANLENSSAAERLAAFHEGESLGMLLKGIKRRIREEHRQLDQIKMGLARTQAPRAAKIDLRG